MIIGMLIVLSLRIKNSIMRCKICNNLDSSEDNLFDEYELGINSIQLTKKIFNGKKEIVLNTIIISHMKMMRIKYIIFLLNKNTEPLQKSKFLVVLFSKLMLEAYI